MKKNKNIVLIFIFIIFIVSISGCKNDNSNNKELNEDSLPDGYDTSEEVIHIWKYVGTNNGENTSKLIPLIEYYCKTNNIPYQLHCYYENEITFEDYELKRNLNLNNPNTIVFGGTPEFNSKISSEHADYNKIQEYANIADSCKQLPIIPISYMYDINLLNKKLLDYYSIQYDKEIVLFDDYYEILNQLINSGAKFNITWQYFYLDTTYLCKKNNLFLNIDDTSEKIDDNYINSFKSVVKELLKRGNDLNIFESTESGFEYDLIDENTNMKLFVGKNSSSDTHLYYMPDYNGNNNNYLVQDISDTLIYFVPRYIEYAIYIGENVTNEKIYDIANYMMSSDFLSQYTFGNYMLKNDNENNLYKPSVTSDTAYNEQVLEYCNNNANAIKNIDKILNENILNGNISSESVKTLINNTYKINYFISSNIYKFVYDIYVDSKTSGSIDKSTQNFFDNQMEDFITSLKLRL